MGMSKAPSRNNTANTNNRSNEGKKLLKVHNSHISTTQNMMMIDTRVSQRKDGPSPHLTHHYNTEHDTDGRVPQSEVSNLAERYDVSRSLRNETNRANKERVQVFRSHALIAMAGVTAKGMKTSARMYPALSLRDDGVSVK